MSGLRPLADRMSALQVPLQVALQVALQVMLRIARSKLVTEFDSFRLVQSESWIKSSMKRLKSASAHCTCEKSLRISNLSMEAPNVETGAVAQL
jgi:hypothetical protein